MDEIEKIVSIFRNILQNENAYFEPPPNYIMKYPGIRITLDEANKKKADNKVYGLRKRYSVALITQEVRLDIITSILQLPYCEYGRSFVKDNLRNTFFTFYY